jgi:hypothetical protein
MRWNWNCREGRAGSLTVAASWGAGVSRGVKITHIGMMTQLNGPVAALFGRNLLQRGFGDTGRHKPDMAPYS